MIHPAKSKDKIAVFSTESIEDGTAKLTNAFHSKSNEIKKVVFATFVIAKVNFCDPSIEETSTVSLIVKTVESAVKETHNTCESKNVSPCG